jgi:methylmalonyl-CoA mutase N-terminal domain/subunit
VLGYETGVTDTVDPLGGSYFVESLTNEVESRAWEYLEKIDGMGGSVQAIEAGWIQDEIHEAAFRKQHAVETEEQIIVGVNRWAEEDEPVDIQAIDEAEVEAQKDRVRQLRKDRDQDAVESALAKVIEAANGSDNLLPLMREALRARATLGEVSDALRSVFGVYTPNR